MIKLDVQCDRCKVHVQIAWYDDTSGVKFALRDINEHWIGTKGIVLCDECNIKYVEREEQLKLATQTRTEQELVTFVQGEDKK